MFCKTGNLSQTFEKLKIVLDLEKRFRKEKTIIGMAIMTAIENKKPGDQIILMLKSQISDNSTMMERVLGESLYYRIKQYPA
jgi:hypothetical protein